MINRVHQLFNSQIGRVFVELPIYLAAIYQPDILGKLSLTLLISQTKQIQKITQRIIFGYTKIETNFQSLGRAKSLVEMEPEPGYGDQIKEGIRRFRYGSQ